MTLAGGGTARGAALANGAKVAAREIIKRIGEPSAAIPVEDITTGRPSRSDNGPTAVTLRAEA